MLCSGAPDPLLLPAALSDALESGIHARSMTSKIESNTTGEAAVSPRKSIIEHCVDTEFAEFAELALGLGSSRPRPMVSASSAYISSSSAMSMAEGCRRILYGFAGWFERGVMIGERTRVFKSLEGTRTPLRLLLLPPKLLKEELGEDLIEGVVDEDGEVMLLDGLFADERCRGLWLKMVCSCRRTFEDEVVWFRKLLEGVCLMIVSSCRVSKRETNCATAIVLGSVLRNMNLSLLSFDLCRC